MKSIQNQHVKGPTLKGFKYGQKREEPLDNLPRLGKHDMEEILCVNSTSLLVETDSGVKMNLSHPSMIPERAH